MSDTPIYDSVEREWLTRGRTVPRAPAPWAARAVNTGDLFLRA
ncbi:hypothetical protein [Streptomyces virginiae]